MKRTIEAAGRARALWFVAVSHCALAAIALWIAASAVACGSSDSASPKPDASHADAAGDDAAGDDGGGDDGPSADVALDSAKMDSGAHDSAPDAPSGPCGSIPAAGICVTSSSLQYCSVPTGVGTPTVVTKICAIYEQCTIVAGHATCTPKPGMCEPGASECVSSSQSRYCDSTGNWNTQTCAGCQNSSLGATCTGVVATTPYNGIISYQARGPNSGLTDWTTTPFTAVANGAMVASYSYDSQSQSYSMLDQTTTDAQGAYTIQIPTSPQSQDLLVVWAIRSVQNVLKFAVASPDIPDGQWNLNNPIPSGGTNANFWGWSTNIVNLGSPGSTFLITESMGSGAMRVFDYLRYVYGVTSSLAGSDGKSLVIWLRMNTSWSCGSCFAPWPITFKGQPFQSQLFIPAVATDTEYWSDAVTAHELGHWTMASYGTSPNEGGPHQVACPTLPGQAWSEGWATGLSSLARRYSVYYDKQQGSFFWFDIAQRTYGSGALWQLPDSQGGLLQNMDENQVASYIWALADNATTQGLNGNQKFLDALRSTRMNTSPFPRGYTSHTWSGSCQRTNVVDTMQSAPMLADFFDALLCNNLVSASQLAGVLGSYPFPTGTPVCQ